MSKVSAISGDSERTEMAGAHVYDDAFYEMQVEGALASARILVAHLMSYYRPASVADVGCGRGAWLKAFHEVGCQTLIGLDGHWNSQARMIDDAIEFNSVDLNSRFHLAQKVDLVVSLEVAEHLAPSSSAQFVDCITTPSDAVLFSAAFTGQGGTGHLNEQRHSFWACLFRYKDFVPFDICRPVFWGDSRVCYWYRQNAFLYLRKGSAAFRAVTAAGGLELTNLDFMNCIHPDLYDEKCKSLSFRSHLRDLLPSFVRAVRGRLRK